ncbi:MAG TPA: DUF433 domain-containing protein [Thermoanaerobaculia bacterium]|jgi:uncharacterized protein (DUF433 family)|nr:DUF433 domain-containing protein [Thermoanaerobaculia bacterium]
MSTATTYQYIFLDEEGVAQIAGANTKVVEVVLLSRASGESPEELSADLPHLSPAQIHSALAYYGDHKSELDDEISRSRDEADALRAELGQAPVAERLARMRRS